jgi:hypothetical protein
LGRCRRARSGPRCSRGWPRPTATTPALARRLGVMAHRMRMAGSAFRFAWVAPGRCARPGPALPCPALPWRKTRHRHTGHPRKGAPLAPGTWSRKRRDTPGRTHADVKIDAPPPPNRAASREPHPRAPHKQKPNPGTKHRPRNPIAQQEKACVARISGPNAGGGTDQRPRAMARLPSDARRGRTNADDAGPAGRPPPRRPARRRPRDAPFPCSTRF